MNRKIQILDCTLRDGGLALKTNCSEGNRGFSDNIFQMLPQSLGNANIDIIELGMLSDLDNEEEQFGVFYDLKRLSQYLHGIEKKSIFAAFIQNPDVSLDDIPEYNNSLCQLIRVGIRYSELEKSLWFCEELVKKGYKVSIQPIVTTRYTKKDMEMIAQMANRMKAYSVYIVDSYGAMFPEDVLFYYRQLDSLLNVDIKIGLHMHNNLDSALHNVSCVLNETEGRDIIIDSCCLGMGQGAGNIQTEVLVNYLNRLEDGSYNFSEIMKCCDMLSEYWNDNAWGYSVAYMIAGRHGVAYKYGKLLYDKYHFSYEKIDEYLRVLPDDVRYRYTEENLESIAKGIYNEGC